MNLKTDPELLPLIEFWEKDGKQTLALVLGILVVFAGYKGWVYHRESVRNAASEALVNAYTTEEIEEAATKFSGGQSANAFSLRLAKSYFDGARYEEALAQYEALVGKVDASVADIPVVGKAQCLEALGRYDEAAKAFGEFAAANPKSYLALTAQLGSARAIALGGDRQKALDQLAALKKTVEGDEFAKARVETTEKLVKRYEKKVEEAPKAAEAK